MSVLLKRDLWVFDGPRGFGDLLDALRRPTRARPSSAEVVATAIALNGGERPRRHRMRCTAVISAPPKRSRSAEDGPRCAIRAVRDSLEVPARPRAVCGSRSS